MATEKNLFDEFLKENLCRDIFFRGIAWVLIPSVAFYYAVFLDGVSSFDFMVKTTDAIMRVLNFVGVLAIFLAVAALMFKDMECINPTVWGQQTKKGYLGAVVRRLAGDLTTWALAGC